MRKNNRRIYLAELGLGSRRAETLEGWFSAQPKNRLNVGRGFTPRRKNSSAGYKTLPYKGKSAQCRARVYTAHRK